MAAELKVALVMSAVDRATSVVRRLNTELARMQAPARGLKQQFSKLWDLSGVGRFSGALRNVGREVGVLWLKMAGITAGAAFAFQRTFVQTASEFEKLQFSLEVVEGSIGKAGDRMNWIIDLAKKTPYETQGITKAYLMLKNAGIDPLNGALQSLLDFNSRIGGSNENLIEVTRQLGQSWMKNKLQMEEVNVLTERMIPVIPLLARALGKTEQQIMGMISKSQIGRKELAKLFVQMGKEGAGSAEKFSRSWEGVTSTLSDTWKMAQKVIMDQGAFDWMKDKVVQATDWLSDLLPTQKAPLFFAAKAADMMPPVEVNKLVQIGQQLRAVFEGFEQAVIRVWVWTVRLKDAVGGWANLFTIGAVMVAAVIAWPLLLAIGQLVSAVIGLAPLFAVAIGALLTPIGLVVAAFAAAAIAVYTYWGPISAFFSSLGAQIVAIWNSAIAAITAAIRGVYDAIVNVFSSIRSYISSFDLAGAGARMIETFVSGIKSRAAAAYNAVKGVFSGIANLIPHSDAKEGPFSRLTAAGRAIPETMAYGIRMAAPMSLKPAVAGAFAGAMSPTFAATPPPSTITSRDTYNITVNSGPGQNPRDIANAVMREIESRQRQSRRAAFHDGGL